MKNKFLFELGLEEVPADMIEPAATQLRQSVEALFDENQLTAETLDIYAAPRRLAFLATGLPDRQPSREEILLGPPVSVAFRDGVPAPAAQGFARKMQVTVEQLEVVKTEKGDYLALKRTLEGRETPRILADALPGIIASISWPRNMYWQESRFRFVRPIRWLVALWNKETVPVSLEGLTAGAVTRGHRFLGRSDVLLKSAGEYLECLRENYVLADLEERRTKILRELERETPQGLKVISDPELLHLVCYLNEYPTVLRGSFNSDFLTIPQEVLITVMRHHQKYFSAADETGALQPHFLTVLNTSGDPEGKIRKGHEKVLRARLEDAAFFWTTDLKTPLKDRLPLLDHVLFQEKLGSYRTKTERVRRLCSMLAPDKDLETAASLSKCDLTSDMVRELSELQGVMGGLYAREERYPESVWRAVYEQYKPSSLEDSSPATLTGALLALTDKLDTVVGCFAAGIVPTGSSDPFALRRQAQGLVKILFDYRLDQYPLPALVECAGSILKDQIAVPNEVVADVLAFLTGRVRFILQERGVPFDVLNAVLAPGVAGVYQTWLKAQALTKMRGDADFEALAIAFKRVKNILGKQEIVLRAVSEADLEDAAEAELYRSFREVEPPVSAAAQAGDYEGALRKIATLRGPVDRLFDAVLVMAEDPRLRNNRLRMLFEISDMFLKIADISEIQEKSTAVE
jgi:glycyl-tRNA synthetase beta chain